MEATATRITAERYYELTVEGDRKQLVEGRIVVSEPKPMHAFRKERIPRDLYAYPEQVPDLCVEIRSPGAWRYDVGAKKRVYEDGGLPELWLVDDTSDSVLVYRRSGPDSPTFDVALELGGGETLISPLLPGFALELDQLFKR